MGEDRLAIHITQFSDALKRLEQVYTLEKNDYIRDSAIKRFELVFELAWKTIQSYVRAQGLDECHSPRSCFKEAYICKLIEYDDIWFAMIDARNRTAHTYNQQTADQVYKDIPQFIPYFKELLVNLNNTAS